MTLKRICFLGNSHVGAIRLGLARAREEGAFPDCQIDVYGSHRDMVRDYEIDGAVLRPRSPEVRKTFAWTSGGHEAIDLRAYDVLVIVVGMPLHDIRLFAAGGVLPEMETDLIDAVISGWEGSWWMRLGRDAAAAAGGLEVVHLGQPLISEAAPQVRKLRSDLQSPDHAFSARLERVTDRLRHHRQTRTADAVSVVDPVPEVLDKTGRFTRHDFSRGSRRLTEGMDLTHPEDDFGHMNAQYGEIVLRRLLARAA